MVVSSIEESMDVIFQNCLYGENFKKALSYNSMHELIIESSITHTNELCILIEGQALLRTAMIRYLRNSKHQAHVSFV